MAFPRGRPGSLGVLFGVIALGFVALAVYAALEGVWLVAVPTSALTIWMAELCLRTLR